MAKLLIKPAIYLYLFTLLIISESGVSQSSFSRTAPNSYQLERNSFEKLSGILCLDSLQVEGKFVKIFKLLPELIFEIDGSFYSYEFRKNNSEEFTNLEPYNYIKHFKVQLDNSLSKQIAISWERSSYGSGGGIKFRGVLIVDFVRSSCLLDEITYESIENFPHGNEGYFIYVKRPILISGKRVKISKISPSKYVGRKELQSITDLKEGEYFLDNYTLKLIETK